MSLREKIYNELESVTNFRVHEDDLNKSTDKILFEIEKRIDLTLENIKRDIEVVSKSDLKYQPNLDIQLHHIYNLKEMLK